MIIGILQTKRLFAQITREIVVLFKTRCNDLVKGRRCQECQCHCDGDYERSQTEDGADPKPILLVPVSPSP